MSEVAGIVIAVDGDVAVVETDPRAAGCGRCHEPGGCGGGLLNMQDSGDTRRYRIINTINVAAGDQVLLCAPEGAVLKAALLTYGLPLLLIICGAALATWRFGGDAAAVVGGVAGLIAGLLLLRIVARQGEPVLNLRLKSPDNSAANISCLERKSTI